MSLCITHCDQREENCAGDVLTANDEKHMRSASFILHIGTFAPSSAASPLSRHLTLTFCFSSCSVTDCTQSMSVTFCVLTKKQPKKQPKNHPKRWALPDRVSTGSPVSLRLGHQIWLWWYCGTASLIISSSPAPPLSGPLEVMLIT